MSRSYTRRDFFKLAGGALVGAAGAGLYPALAGKVLRPTSLASAQGVDLPRMPDLYWAGTDGWIALPATPAIPPYHPDTYAPVPGDPGFSGQPTTYIFGFRNLTGLTPEQKANQKMHAQHTAPMFWAIQGSELHVTLTNLGLAQRPDLTDSHTIHWHGFRDAIPYFDGEPHGSVSVPVGKELTYVYRPKDPGTYMYHCHVEDVEHVQMGMAGPLFVYPSNDGITPLRQAYSDPSTAFDREWAMLLTEVWAEAHWDDAHIQVPEWSDYHVDFALLNGRVYPDTIAPNGSIDPFNPVRDADGYLVATPGYEHLQYQPLSSLVTCNAGEKVLLRFSNLGYTTAYMTCPGIKMRVVGRDATPMKGRDGTDTSYLTTGVSVHVGASFDAIFTAPAYNTEPAGYNTYLLYNRNYRVSNNLAAGGFGGQMTEVRVYPAGTLPPQTLPNT
jgi:FtsP/CotA-like multicopper oxidase with cupredoxin domain